MPMPVELLVTARDRIVLGLMVGLSIVGVPLYILWLMPHQQSVAWSAGLAMILGELVGFSEIISRYRDEPLLATFNRYGLSYLLINGSLSLIAFILLRHYADQIFPAVKDQPFLAATAAGFGAMAIFRSKLFIFRSEDGKEYPIGPDLVLVSILRIIDRKVDRLRASRRQRLVFDKASGVAQLLGNSSDFSTAANFLVVSMSSFQNLSDSEKDQIAAAVERLKKELTNAPNLYKAMALGFALLDIAGEENFNALVEDLQRYLRGTAQNGGPQPSGAPVSTAPAGVS